MVVMMMVVVTVVRVVLVLVVMAVAETYIFGLGSLSYACWRPGCSVANACVDVVQTLCDMTMNAVRIPVAHAKQQGVKA
jgi:hypothetical protein